MSDFKINVEDLCNGFDDDVTIKCFDCLGPASYPQEQYFHPKSFIINTEVGKIFHKTSPIIVDEYNNIVDLFTYSVDIGVAFTSQCAKFFNLARKNLQLLERTCMSASHLTHDVHSGLDYFHIRKQITDLLYESVQFLKFIQASGNHAPSYFKELTDRTTAMRLYMKSFSDLPNYVISHSISKQGNKCSQAGYHLFHGHLEWRWHNLIFNFELSNFQNLEKIKDETTGLYIGLLTDTVFEEYLLLFMADLVTIAIEIFEKTQTSDLLNVTPFSCCCIRESWLLLQLLVEELSSRGRLKHFWVYFNDILSRVGAASAKHVVINDCTKLKLAYTYKCTNASGFAVWLLINIGHIQGFDKEGQFIGSSCDRVSSNYEQLVPQLKACIVVEGTVMEAHLRLYMNLISDILTKWWEPKNDIITLLWEYFQKRLDSVFFVPGATIDTMATCSKSAIGFLNQIKQRLSSLSMPRNETSYNSFLYLLGKYFIRCREKGEVGNWQKFKGRLYSKLPQNKLSCLSQTGFMNFGALFLTLAISIDVKELGMKLENLLSQLSSERLDDICKFEVVKIYLALIILSVQEKVNIAYAAKGLLDLVNSSYVGRSEDGNSIVRLYIEGLRYIIEASQDFQLSEYLLIDSWIPKYLHTCNQHDQSKLLDIIIIMMTKLQKIYQQEYSMVVLESSPRSSIEPSINSFSKASEMLWLHVLPFIRQNATSNNAISQVADIAVLFSLFSLFDQNLSAKFDQSFSLLFKYFSQNENVNIRITRRYLCRIFANKDATCHLYSQIHKLENHLVQSWIKCSILCHEDFTNQEMNELFSTIIEFTDVRQLYDSSDTFTLTHDGNIIAFIKLMGTAYNDASTFQEKGRLRELFSSYFSVLERYVIPLGKNPTSLDLTFHIYYIIGTCFLHCSRLMYIRSKPSCLLHVLLTHLILPPTLFMDKKPHPYIIAAMRKYWHLYIKGLFYLDHRTDSYIEKSLKDLVVVYIPYFTSKYGTMDKFSTPQPMRELLCSNKTQDALLVFVYDKIATNFLACRGKQVNQNSALILMSLLDITNRSKNESRTMNFFIMGLMPSLLEQVMFLDEFCPSRKVAWDIVEIIAGTPMFSSSAELQNKFLISITSLVQKHLAFSANCLFRLLCKLSDVMPDIVENAFPSVQDQVTCVEARRGVGRDEGLRNSLRALKVQVQRAKPSQAGNANMTKLG